MTSPLELATCSISGFRPDMGVPILTTVGTPRQWNYAHSLVCKSLTPYGIYGKYAGQHEYQIAYDDRLVSKQRIIDRELRDLFDAYGGKRLVLLCFCNLSKRGSWCHRRMAAAWLEQQYKIEVPELSGAYESPRVAHPRPVPQPGLFD